MLNVFTILLLLCVGSGWAAQSEGFTPKGPLAGLPSAPDSAHLEKLKAIPDNTWVDLGPPQADPKWGKARGRAWTPKMAFAPELRGAFFCATGVHGYVKPDGHYMDDLWFYDINTHRWICLYPGADKTLKLHLDKNGLEVNDDGDHIPVSYLSHGYNNMTYSPDHHKYMIIHTQCPWWGNALPQRWAWLDQNEKGVATKNYGSVGSVIASAKHPWFWDAAAGKWDRKFIEGPGPASGRFEGVLEYVPSQKKAYYLYRHNEVWIYDFGANTWSAGPKHKAPVYDNVACFDSKRERIWIGKNEQFGYHDTKSGTWTGVTAKNQPANFGGGNYGCMTYDSANDMIVFTLTSKDKSWNVEQGTYVYNPADETWSAPTPLPKLPGYCGTAFYDPETNTHFCYYAGDSGDKGSMLAYRCRNVKK